MADAEYLKLLEQGVERWNRWREKNSEIFAPNLRNARLAGTNLRGANLRGADLGDTPLHGTDLSNANLSYANLRGADLSEANLSYANLRGAHLSSANLCEANLHNANLHGANLRDADLSCTNLCGANLVRTQVLRTKFSESKLTGACIEDWNTNSTTRFDGAVCEYVYLKEDQQERRPRQGFFKLGEFSTLFQQAVDTIDLIFKDGIDWQAFFQSFQDLRDQYADQDLSIQGIERKRGGAFIIRLEVAEDADKKSIESSAKEFYTTKLTLLEQRYRAELKAKDGEIVAYREQSANLMKITEMLAARPPMTETPKYDLRGAQFAGGFAETVQGDQVGGTINNYGPNTEDITHLLTALRDQAQTFPTDQKDNANDILDDLERDLKEEQPDQNRISRRLKKLVALGAAIGTIASGAAAVSGDISTFTGNVIELTEKLGIPIEQVQLPPSDTP
ncbi:MAG: pentapeptide repeat-containing protein [Leptolyngbya sp. SIO3F4]|nr:pentapeptide repeat-containing protein [Leptolyngbya sp. SIO3F4]